MSHAHKIHDQQGVYFITCTVVQWINVFTRYEYADIVVESLKYCQQHKGLEIFGWVIMSNHLHLIVACKDGYNLSDALRDFKKFTSGRIVNAIETNPHESRKHWLLWLLRQDGNISFWQEGNRPIAITSDKFFLQKLNYIHANPVNAGMIDREEAYVYSSARDFNGMKGLLDLTDFY